MARSRPFRQVDVFTAEPTLGNPVAVVLDADDLTDAEMAAFARWTNLSETTFVLAPTDPGADYRVRIFTPGSELPFAGHPTLGSAHAWLEAGGSPAVPDTLFQECAVGLVRLRRDGERLAFAAPPVTATEVAPATLAAVTEALGLDPGAVVAARLLANGPTWCVLRLGSAAEVLALAPDMAALAAVPGAGEVGVVGPHPPGGPAAVEVRGFAPGDGIPEDPVTGSLNASVAQWLQGEGVLPERYVAAQGTAMGRRARERGAGRRGDVGGGRHGDGPRRHLHAVSSGCPEGRRMGVRRAGPPPARGGLAAGLGLAHGIDSPRGCRRAGHPSARAPGKDRALVPVAPPS